MATNSVTVTPSKKYQLGADDRKNLLASIPPKTHLPQDFVPHYILQQNSNYCPELKKITHITYLKMDEILVAKIQQERQKFIDLYGNDGVFNAALNNECTM